MYNGGQTTADHYQEAGTAIKESTERITIYERFRLTRLLPLLIPEGTRFFVPETCMIFDRVEKGLFFFEEPEFFSSLRVGEKTDRRAILFPPTSVKDVSVLCVQRACPASLAQWTARERERDRGSRRGRGSGREWQHPALRSARTRHGNSTPAMSKANGRGRAKKMEAGNAALRLQLSLSLTGLGWLDCLGWLGWDGYATLFAAQRSIVLTPFSSLPICRAVGKNSK